MRFIFLLSVWGMSSFPISGKASIDIILASGESKVMKAPFKDLRVSEKPPFKITPQKGSIEIRGLRPGQGTLYLDNEAREIVVLSTEEGRSWLKVREVLENTVGVQTKWERGGLVVQGRIYSLGQWKKILHVFSRHPLKWSNHLSLSKDLEKQIQSEFAKEFKAQRESSLTLGFYKPWSLELTKHLSEKEKIQNLLRTWGIKPVVLESTLELKPVIRVNMAIAELKIETLQKIGLEWPTSFSAKIIDFSEIEFNDLVMAAHALESQGRGKVLAKPNILARSGSEAEFLAGGEFPIKIKNFASQDVVWKKYGVLLKILPVADHSGRISLKIDTEISQIDMARAVDGVPGLTTNRVSSHFDLAQSQSVALSGLLRLENHEKRQGLSFLQRIPLLGALFSSQDFIESKSELVIFVRPEIVRNLTEDIR